MAKEHELEEEADAFFETWSIDSDGHWHDRFERRQAEQERPQYFFEIYDNIDLRVRRLELAMPQGLPVIPGPRLVLQPMFEAGPSPPALSRGQQISPQGRDVSPMSVASTVPAVYDPTLPALRPLPGFSDHSPTSWNSGL